LDNQVTKGLLGQTATTQGTPGKLGNEDAQNEVRHDFRDDDAEQLEETLQRDLVRPFIDLNFGPQENYPQIQLRAVAQEDIVALSEALAKLVPLGLRVEQSVVRDKLGLPDPEKNAEVLAQPSAPSIPPTAPNAQWLNAVQQQLLKSLNRAQTVEDDDIDRAADEALADWQPLVTPVVDPIRVALEEAVDEADFARRLGEILANQDVGALTRSLSSALFKARVEGEAQ
jgi:phage gp29-like protein